MKSSILLLVFISSFCFSCRKNFEDRIIGEWKLVSSYRQRTFDRDHFITGYEPGVFRFNENGTASYTSRTDTLNGTWSADRYSNSNGDGSYKELVIQLVNFRGNQFLFWEFDDFNFRDTWKEIRAKEFSLSNDRIYEFRRQ